MKKVKHNITLNNLSNTKKTEANDKVSLVVRWLFLFDQSLPSFNLDQRPVNLILRALNSEFTPVT